MKAVDVPNCWDSIEAMYEAAYDTQRTEPVTVVSSEGASDTHSDGHAGARESNEPASTQNDEPQADAEAAPPQADEAPKRRTRRTRQ